MSPALSVRWINTTVKFLNVLRNIEIKFPRRQLWNFITTARLRLNIWIEHVTDPIRYDGGAQFINGAAIWPTFLASCCCSCQVTSGELEGVTKWKNWGHEVYCNPRALNLTSHTTLNTADRQIVLKWLLCLWYIKIGCLKLGPSREGKLSVLEKWFCLQAHTMSSSYTGKDGSKKTRPGGDISNDIHVSPSLSGFWKDDNRVERGILLWIFPSERDLNMSKLNICTPSLLIESLYDATSSDTSQENELGALSLPLT